jgi:bifunctional NMN adenylyltransferase/nudix hydrolase
MRYGVFIGRFQPIHNGHLSVITDALSQVDKLIIVIGSANTARNPKNPWSAGDRQEMIQACLGELGVGADFTRYKFIWANDYTYNDNMWVSQIQNQIDEETNGSDDVTLFGRDKDHSTYYLKLFPQWKFSPAKGVPDMDATRIRNMYFSCDLLGLQKYVPECVLQRLKSYMMLNAVTCTDSFLSLKEEFEQLGLYKQAHVYSDPKIRYAPSFNTTDAVVIKSGHVLLVRRKFHPGKGLMALPGGFIGETEKTFDACLRELKEETGIQIPSDEIRKCLVGEHLFDDPARSLRGRTYTYAYAFDLGSGKLPRVKGNDDADKAFWLPISEVSGRGDEFFEDHCHIIQYFVNRF